MPSSVTYPDGSVLTSSALSVNAIETIFQTLTMQMIGLTVTDANSQIVRIGWQIEGQPGPSRNTDILFVRCWTEDTEYSRLRDQVRGNSGINTIVINDVFTRTWKTFWTIYGPNSLDNARAIRSGLIGVPFVQYTLSTSNLYVNPSIEEPLRVPELFQGTWWERVDLEACFNEQITETLTIGTVASVEVKVYDKTGQLADLVINP